MVLPAVRADVLGVQALRARQLVVELDRAALPLARERVDERELELGAVERRLINSYSVVTLSKKLIKQVGLFDVYRGDKIAEGKKQYALSFVMQDLDKTLTDNDVEKVMNKLLSTFQNEFGATLR